MLFRLTQDLNLAEQYNVYFFGHRSLFEQHISRLELSYRELAEQLFLLLFRAAFQSDLRWEYVEELFLAPMSERFRVQESFINFGRDAVDNGVRLNGSNRLDRVAVKRVELPALLRDGADARAAIPPGQATLRGSVSFILREDGLHGCD